jgi:hypothetical protein
VLAAATEFGKHHAQEMILIARKLQEGESDPAERLGLTILLNEAITLEEAVEVTALVQDRRLKGATFAPKRHGTVAVYHTDNLGMTPAEFQGAATLLLEELLKDYPALSLNVQKYIIHMPRL